MTTDQTNLYGSGILQKNVFKLHNKLITDDGNTSYPSDMSTDEGIMCNPSVIETEQRGLVI